MISSQYQYSFTDLPTIRQATLNPEILRQSENRIVQRSGTSCDLDESLYYRLTCLICFVSLLVTICIVEVCVEGSAQRYASLCLGPYPITQEFDGSQVVSWTGGNRRAG